MSNVFLLVLTSHRELGTTGNKTGSWLEELAAPYWRFVDAGFRVVLASPKGGVAPLDPMSLEEAWISPAGRRFLTDPGAGDALKHTVALDQIDSAGMDGIFLVGGTATTWDFPHNATLKRIIEEFHPQGKVIAGVCHGVIGLIQAVDRNGEPLVKNRQLTAISNAEDVMMGVDKVVPVLPEDMLRKLRAIYSATAPFAEHVVCDPPFFTGQNPASADALAVKIVAHVQKKSTHAAAHAGGQAERGA
jgi:putative intracellular protease/amidase